MSFLAAIVSRIFQPLFRAPLLLDVERGHGAGECDDDIAIIEADFKRVQESTKRIEEDNERHNDEYERLMRKLNGLKKWESILRGI